MHLTTRAPYRVWTIYLWALVLLVVTLAPMPAWAGQGQRERGGRTPVIFDTDICDDIDDTWALVMLLNSPELNVKLITTAVGNTELKAKTVAKILEIAGRTDIPIGIGVKHSDGGNRQDAWVAGYDLGQYPGTIHRDGVQAIIDTIMKSERRITLIAVGPLPNIGAALDKEPGIAEKARFIGMHGSIYKGYGGSDTPSAEYNVKAHNKDCRKVFTAGWPMTITPLDTCGLVHLTGPKYQQVLKSDRPLAKALMENYLAWQKQPIAAKDKNLSDAEVEKQARATTDQRSSTLFDTVGIYLALSTDLVEMERLPLIVTDDGLTRIDGEKGKPVRCAVRWKDLGAYEDYLVERLLR